MSTIKSSSEHLTINADGAGKEVKIQRNGTQVLATTSTGIDVSGSVTATRIGTGTVATLKDSSGHGFQIDIPSSSKLQIASAQASKTLDLWANELTFSAGNSERMRIDSAGRVTMPYQPYAFVDFGGGAYAAYSGIVPFDNILANQGNHYNTSTYKFTCPVDGIYSVQVGVLSQNPTDSYHADVYHNGVSVTRNHCTYRSTQASSNIKCSANDTLWIQTDSINLYGGNGTSTYCRAIYTLLG